MKYLELYAKYFLAMMLIMVITYAMIQLFETVVNVVT